MSGACDLEGTQHDQAALGPPVRVVGTNLGPGGTIAADGVLQIAFDRYLLPSTITRQSYVILGGDNRPIPTAPLKTVYDPVARTVTIAGPGGPGEAWLTVDQPYKLVLLVPRDAQSDLGGFRAIDRAALAPDQPREFTFRAGPPAGGVPREPSVDFCADVLPVFQAKCASPVCHGAGPRAANGLVLSDADGISAARSRIAEGASTGARSVPEPPSTRFGRNMALIEPGDPGSSWLLYKMELAPLPPHDAPKGPRTVCEGAPSPTAAAYAPLAPIEPVTSRERERLGDYVLGRPMPYPAHEAAYAFQPLTFQEREQVRVWIARGADVRDCGPCSFDPLAPAADF